MKKILFLLSLFILTSCSNFLDIKPREDVSIQEQFSSVQGVLQALNGAYLKTEDLASSNAFIYADLQGGNLSFSPVQSGSSINLITPPVNITNVYNFNENATESAFNSYYADSYQTIANINYILKYTPNIESIPNEQKNQILAEAYTLRAFIHFNLLQFFSQTYNYSTDASHIGIVYADRVLQGGVDFEIRKPVSVCYQLVKKDLDTALSLFTAGQAMTGPAYSYFNTISTKAFYARVALQSNDYGKAITMANDVVTKSGLVLMPMASYITEWEKPNSAVSEVILEFTAPLDSKVGVVSSTVAAYYNSFQNTSSTYRYCASLDLIALFDANDIRKNNFIAVDMNYISTNGLQTRAFYFPKKFQDNAGTLNIRLSEMYLILAEANARLKQFDEAKKQLNKTRNRANLSDITSNDNLLDEIFLERRKELCFEGFLLFDSARFNKAITRNLDCFSTVCSLNFPNNKVVLPIPQETKNVNQNIIQNEGY